jgi:hypothetical protein
VDAIQLKPDRVAVWMPSLRGSPQVIPVAPTIVPPGVSVCGVFSYSAPISRIKTIKLRPVRYPALVCEPVG